MPQFFPLYILEPWDHTYKEQVPHCRTSSMSLGKESACNAGDAGDTGLISGSGRSPGEGPGNLLQYSCLENPHGPTSLVGCSPWGCRESDMTEHGMAKKKKPKKPRTFQVMLSS